MSHAFRRLCSKWFRALPVVWLASLGCQFDPSGGSAQSVLHKLFPEIAAILTVSLPPGSVGGLAYGDFDCDGERDLAVGVPDRDLFGAGKAGVVQVYYASGESDQLYASQIDGAPEQADAAFGFSLAAADFDGARCDDLAIGAPGHDSGSAENAGRVYVVRGHGARGLWIGDLEILAGTGADHFFGTSLAAGYFNADGNADLAVGLPKYDAWGKTDAGTVEVFYGGSDGFALQVYLDQHFDVRGEPEPHDLFGFSLEAGDFDGNGIDDLAVGVPGECDESFFGNCEFGWGFDGQRGGAINVFYGIEIGLSRSGDQLLSQARDDLKGGIESRDGFGFSLASGDFDGDRFADLAIGVPGESLGDDLAAAGSVNVLYGGPRGLQANGSDGRLEDQLWNLDCSNAHTCGPRDIPGQAAPNDLFGIALAAGDLDGDRRYDDLAIGVPGYRSLASGEFEAGAVSVLFGSARGLDTPAAQFLNQDTGGVPGVPESADLFGSALALGEAVDGGPAQLAVRVNDGDPCAVNLLFGSGAARELSCSTDGIPAFPFPHAGASPGAELVAPLGPRADPEPPGTPGDPHGPVSLVATPRRVGPGQQITLRWQSNDLLTFRLAAATPSEPVGRTAPLSTFVTSAPLTASFEIAQQVPVEPAEDWVGLFQLGTPNEAALEWYSTEGLATGSLTFTAPDSRGEYEFRYLPNGGYESVASSGPVVVAPEVELRATPSELTAREPIEVCWEITLGAAVAEDSIGLFLFGERADEPLAETTTGDADAGCVWFDAPAVATPTRYRFHYLLDGGLGGLESVASADVAVLPPYDRDADGWVDADDNCPDVPNPDQLDRGGIGRKSSSDGIGDACQCGDVDGDGEVDRTDVNRIRAASSGRRPYEGTVIGALCNVTPGDTSCNAGDAEAIHRALLGVPVPGGETHFAGLCPGLPGA